MSFAYQQLRRPPQGLPGPGGILVAAGDSITDPYSYVTGVGIMGGWADNLAAATATGWTRAGAGLPGQAIVTAPGSGYAASWGFTTTGGGGTTQATGTVYSTIGGGAAFIALTGQGAGFTSAPTVPNGGGGAGAVIALQLAGSVVKLPQAINTNSYDGNRAAIGGTTLQSGGSRGFDLVSTYAARINAYSPAIVVIHEGTNDVVQGLSAANYARDLQTIITGVKAVGNPLIVVTGLLPGSGIATVANRNAFDLQSATVAAANGCPFVYFGGMPPSYLGSDNIHPLAIGHQWMSDRLITALYGGR